MLKGPVLNSEEAAGYCGYRGGAQVMRNLKAQGRGPRSHKVGARLVYMQADLDEWLREQAEEAA